ncbi:MULTISPECIES: TetR/AcrR family transcriptional regulator [unclassified Amycolatopsis]|uniref:TetR/AcrR family transcriptional regulator n=1 Tax=unclassified Amycolatopsis TaxID=2618356 RepID=UPI001FF22C22|nr:TetR/AcrR family transcriptional regulator [Amycolatopsis sp. FBCC-B4732]UOX85324.1 TetR/AcrR family transcriptional regulator [Amycolatopsis sp. FBCC-B4732]
MPRPRVHDLDALLDVAERLVASSGYENVTVRGLATAAGVPNGTIYHAFGSLSELLARVWVRAATAFLDLQTSLVDAAETPVDAVVAAAGTPALFADRRPDAARMLLKVRGDRLFGPELPDELADTLHALDNRLVALLVRLARLVWDRGDGLAVEVITTCVVDLPTAFFRRDLTDPLVRARLAAAVRAVLTVPPREKDRP